MLLRTAWTKPKLQTTCHSTILINTRHGAVDYGKVYREREGQAVCGSQFVCVMEIIQMRILHFVDRSWRRQMHYAFGVLGIENS